MLHTGKIHGTLNCQYTAAKFALDGFFSSLRLELSQAESGVSVTYGVIGGTGKTCNRLFITKIYRTIIYIDPQNKSDVQLEIARYRNLTYKLSMLYFLLFSMSINLFPQLSII